MPIVIRSANPELMTEEKRVPHKRRKRKSKKQVGFLLSKVSPLTDTQKSKLEGELHSGVVKVKKNEDKVRRGMRRKK